MAFITMPILITSNLEVEGAMKQGVQSSCKQNDCSAFHSISTSSHPSSNSSNEDRCCSNKSSSDGSTCESAKLNCYAGAKFGDAPEPVMLPLPPKHWLKCRSSNSSSLKPCDDLSLQLKVILQVA
ncbi:hypothetical protein HELRODRAFT_173235 [Helobdella robusta]|uniref:Uncharacterized protein n=1 Tax=Helobdella robusta TaxID=6412 RepID=T1F6L3_HELRO|nr:hypothetical protein HELRODRAFT_173235 [Helobdella robusta]ESO03536.1 hypothetical protein HELRODRAFT_173235 [Helobdella robusta]